MIFKNIFKTWRSVILTLERKVTHQWIEEYNLAKKIYLIQPKPSTKNTSRD